MFEDQRRFDAEMFRALSENSVPLVRRWAARAMGRIGDGRSVPTLEQLLLDPDTTVQGEAAFALSLVGDPRARPALIDIVLRSVGRVKTSLHVEAVTALARLGDPEVGRLFGEVLGRVAALGRARTDPVVDRMLLESWRLGSDAPLDRLRSFAQSPNSLTRSYALYSLSRLARRETGDLLAAALMDPEAAIREIAAASLHRDGAMRMGLDSAATVAGLRQIATDPDWRVRAQALRALASYRDSTVATIAIDRLTDRNVNVRAQAATMLGAVGGGRAASVLRNQLEGTRFAVRNAAMIALAEIQAPIFDRAAAGWAVSPDWRERLGVARAAARREGAERELWFQALLRDADGRVSAAALASLAARRAPSDPQLIETALESIRGKDPVGRAVAAEILGRAPAVEFVDPLVDAYRVAASDPIPDARLAALQALGAISSSGESGRQQVLFRFLDAIPAPEDYLVRRMAVQAFPEAAARWGRVDKIVTRRGLSDYREVVRRFGIASSPPAVQLTIEVERGAILIQLFPRDAILTVDNLLQLVDRRYFDGQIWSRVVPGFVVQGGDPRGDGWGGPGFVARDELSRHPFEVGTVGLATAGPDSGGSQFFITLGRQPHLDGAFTVLGRVVAGAELLDALSEGERIRRVYR